MTESDAVEATVRDYFEGWHEGDLARMDRALHPGLVKRSADQARSEGATFTTKDRMLELVRAGGGTADRTDQPIEVEVVDVHHDVATAVVRSAQYREYLHLLHTPEGWRIVHAFWQLTDPGPPS